MRPYQCQRFVVLEPSQCHDIVSRFERPGQLVPRGERVHTVGTGGEDAHDVAAKASAQYMAAAEDSVVQVRRDDAHWPCAEEGELPMGLFHFPRLHAEGENDRTTGHGRR